jgi:hypothetical protein
MKKKRFGFSNPHFPYGYANPVIRIPPQIFPSTAASPLAPSSVSVLGLIRPPCAERGTPVFMHGICRRSREAEPKRLCELPLNQDMRQLPSTLLPAGRPSTFQALEPHSFSGSRGGMGKTSPNSSLAKPRCGVGARPDTPNVRSALGREECGFEGATEVRNHYHKNGRDRLLAELAKWGLSQR